MSGYMRFVEASHSYGLSGVPSQLITAHPKPNPPRHHHPQGRHQ